MDIFIISLVSNTNGWPFKNICLSVTSVIVFIFYLLIIIIF